MPSMLDFKRICKLHSHMLFANTGAADAHAITHVRMQGGNVVVGTPGRLQHTMLSVEKFNVKRLELLVLDEADRLLDMGTPRFAQCTCMALFFGFDSLCTLWSCQPVHLNFVD